MGNLCFEVIFLRIEMMDSDSLKMWDKSKKTKATAMSLYRAHSFDCCINRYYYHVFQKLSAIAMNDGYKFMPGRKDSHLVIMRKAKQAFQTLIDTKITNEEEKDIANGYMNSMEADFDTLKKQRNRSDYSSFQAQNERDINFIDFRNSEESLSEIVEYYIKMETGK